MKSKGSSALTVTPDAHRAAALEIENHIEELTDRLVADGWNVEDARAEAMRRFGSVNRVRRTMVRETHAIERRASFLDFIRSIPTDARYALRGLRMNRLFAAIVVGTLGLGIGAATTGFTVVDALLLRPLPFLDPDRLVDINVQTADGGELPLVAPDRALALSKGDAALSGFAYSDSRTFTLTGDGEARNVAALAVSPTLDEVIGLHPVLGRAFDDSDMAPGTKRALVSWTFWKQHGAERSMIGSTIRLDDQAYEVIGVLPRNFKFPVAGTPRDVWVPLTSEYMSGEKVLPYVNGVARLADGVSLDAANARLASLPAPGQTGGPVLSIPGAAPRGAAPLPLHASPIGRWRGNPELVRGVWLLMGAIALMLLVAVVNAMNLTLFRGADRTREIAVRIALGVSRLQLLRHIIVENLLVGLLSGAAAVLVAIAGVAGVNNRLPSEYAFSSAYSFEIGGRVLAFTFIIACTVGLVLGLLPAWRAFRLRDTGAELRSTRGATRGDTRIAHALVVAEIALAVMLLAGAGLLVNSFTRLTHVDAGIDTDHLVLMSLALPQARYGSPELAAAFFDELETRLEADPAIESATVSMGAPPNVSFSFGVELQAEGGDPLKVPKDDPGLLPFIAAKPDFVRTLGIQLVSGRDLDASDVGTDNVLVDSNMAHALWGGDVSGRRFRLDPESKWLTAVGVYRHVRAMGLDDRTTPYGMIRPRNPARASSYMSVVIRPRGNADAALSTVRSVVHAIDRDIPITKLETARAAFSETIDKPRFLARVMGGVSTVALVLAAVGVYGVLSYSVARRRREMGIRMALGAPPADLGLLFLREGLMMTAAGLVIGVMGGLWLVQFARALLYSLAPRDPVTFGVVTIVVLISAALASLIPARIAATTSPASVLRME